MFSEPVDKIDAEISLLNEYALEKKISDIQSSPRKGIEEENEPLSRRSSTPFIKTVMAERTIADYDKFTMYAWSEFQELLKSNFFVIKNGKFFLHEEDFCIWRDQSNTLIKVNRIPIKGENQ